MSPFDAPRLITPEDALSGFECGVAVVDEWLAKRALTAMRHGTAMAYGSFSGSQLAGFYSLSAHAVARRDVGGGWLQRNTPEEIPAILLGMLGVGRAFQGMGLGKSLLGDAIERSLHVARQIGSRALIVDPIDEKAAAFYSRYGFRLFPESPRMFLPLTRSTPAGSPCR